VQRLEDRVQGLESEVQEIKIRVKKIEITQENEVLPRLRNIEECYISTYDRYKEGVSEHEALKQDVSMLKQVVAEHSEKLQKIS